MRAAANNIGSPRHGSSVQSESSCGRSSFIHIWEQPVTYSKLRTLSRHCHAWSQRRSPPSWTSSIPAQCGLRGSQLVVRPRSSRGNGRRWQAERGPDELPSLTSAPTSPQVITHSSPRSHLAPAMVHSRDHDTVPRCRRPNHFAPHPRGALSSSITLNFCISRSATLTRHRAAGHLSNVRMTCGIDPDHAPRREWSIDRARR